jgi:hypothetical protein
MGFRRRTRRRALVAGAAIGAHRANRTADEDQSQEYDDQASADEGADDQANAPAAADPADQIEHLAKLHESGVLTDDEFAAAKAKAIGT